MLPNGVRSFTRKESKKAVISLRKPEAKRTAAPPEPLDSWSDQPNEPLVNWTDWSETPLKTEAEIQKEAEEYDRKTNEAWANESKRMEKMRPKKTQDQLQKEKMDEELADWPWWDTVPRRLVTTAPFMLNSIRDTPFVLPQAPQTASVFGKILENEDIRLIIIKFLFRYHDPAWKFTATCQRVWQYIYFDTAMWDFTRGGYKNCQHSRYESSPTGSQIPSNKEGSVAAIVIVSPVRGPKTYPQNMDNYDALPYAIDKRLYVDQICSLGKLCVCMKNFADFFQNLQLHRIPFLTTDVLSLVIPQMKNLRVLGVYQCQLIHLGHALKLLEIIKTDKPLENENQISLDFFPNYHVGPRSYAGNGYRTGSYGVTWDNWNADTRVGVWRLVQQIIPQARRQNIDFESPYTMFRRYLEKTPCWYVPETLDVMFDPSKDNLDLAVAIDCPNTGGSHRNFMSRIGNRPEHWRWMVTEYYCICCEENVLGIFFAFHDIKDGRDFGTANTPDSTLRCMGCRLIRKLDSETDHFKDQKRGIITRWLSEIKYNEDGSRRETPEWNTDNLPKAFNDYIKRRIQLKAAKLDAIRIQEMEKPGGVDHEHDEQQTPFRRYELTELGKKNMSPEVFSRDQDGAANADYYSRKWAHGHGIAH